MKDFLLANLAYR